MFPLLHWLALLFIYGLLIVKACLEFIPHWDFIAYHLPCALLRYSLTTFTPNQKIQAVCDGFPPLTQIVQGGLVFLTSRLESANLINTLGLVIALLVIRFVFGRRFHYRWFLTSLLAIPMFLLQLSTGYVDVWASMLIVAAFTICLKSSEEKVTMSELLLFVACVSAATLARYQTWGASAVLSGFMIIEVFRQKHFSKNEMLVFLTLLFIGLSSWAIRNTLHFGNPTHPASPPFVSTLLKNQDFALNVEKDSKKNTPTFLQETPPVIRFVVSAFELNRLLPSKHPYKWTLDQAVNIETNLSPHHRLGGWSFLTFFTLLLSLCNSFKNHRIPRRLLVVMLLVVLSIAILKPSHELRYSLFIPFILCLIFARTMNLKSRKELLLEKALISISLIFSISNLNIFTIKPRSPNNSAPPHAVAYWEAETKNSCIYASYVDALFYAGPTFNEYPVTLCK